MRSRIENPSTISKPVLENRLACSIICIRVAQNVLFPYHTDTEVDRNPSSLH